MQNVYMDWGTGKKLQIVDSEGEPFPQQKSVFAFLETYSPVRIFTETSLSCKLPEERNNIIDRAQELGSEIVTVAARTTSTYRKIWDVEKTTDLEDALIIRRIALETDAVFLPIKKATVRPPTLQRRADKLSRAGGVKKHLGPYKQASLLVQETLGDGKNYATVARLFVQAALESNSRQEFLRKVGCYGHGYPNLLRATFYRRVKTLVRQALGKRSLKGISATEIDPLFRHQQKKLQKALRKLYHQVSSARADNPDAEKANRHSLRAA